MPYSAQTAKAQPWDGFLVPTEGRPHMDTKTFAGARVLVTGAGGYIGSALAQELASLPLERIVLLDSAEHGLFLLDHRLEQDGSSTRRTVVVGSICDLALLESLFAEHRPQIIFHAAAYKHVLLMEANPFAAVETNVLGTRYLLQVARQFAAAQCILLSTDKAVDPISIMGATKRLAELMVLADLSATQMKALRLCNVLGSLGSVAPLFCEQIASGRPITVTDPDATRYFLSIQEAVHSLIQCASPHCAKGLYVPMTGEPYRIGDLATYLLRSSSNPIVHTGLRAGDKLHEAMISARETKNREINTLHQVIGVSVDGSELKRVLDVLTSAIRKRDIAQMMHALEAVVPEYSMSALLRSRVQAVEQAMR